MPEQAGRTVTIAIVDYGMGNLYSVRKACEEVGMDGQITSSVADILAADAVVVPGVGAFPDAMATLHRLDLVSVLRDIAQTDQPLVGICLGMQLLMSESEEFGACKGLDIVRGTVEWLPTGMHDRKPLKVPQVGWNTIRRRTTVEGDPWNGTPLHSFEDDTFMYFVHSLFVRPQDPDVIVSTTRYGAVEFCSSLQQGHVFACQYHPERSGDLGLLLYRNIKSFVLEASRIQND